MTKAIIVLRALDDSEKAGIRDILNSSENVRLFADRRWDPAPEHSREIPALDPEEKRAINFDVFDKIIHFGNRTVNSNTISGLLTFGSARLWFYHKFRLYFLVRNLAYDLAIFDKIGRSHQTAELFTDRVHFARTGLLPINVSAKLPAVALGKNKHLRAKFEYLVVAFLRLLIGLFSQRYRLKNIRHVFADSIGQYRTILDQTGEDTVFENAYLGYLYQKADDRFAFIDQLIIPKFSELPSFRFKAQYLRNHGNRKRINEEAIFFRGLISLSVVSDIRRSITRLKLAYPLLYGLKQMDRYDRLMVHSITELHPSSVYYLIKYHVYSRFFRINPVDTVTATDENSPNFKIILDAARGKDITTIGYQHGSMHPLHPAYIYTKMDMEQPPVTDHTLVWGKKWQDMLVAKGHYKPESVHVIGQLRTDVIVNIRNNKRLTKQNLLPQCSDQFVVLFASQPQRDPALRKKAAEDVFRAMDRLPGAHLILKLHPREKDPEYYKQIADDVGCRNYRFSGDMDLYVLLHLADAVITCFSTVGTEAVYFQKPLVILDHLRQDILDYCKDGVAFQTSNEHELTKVLAGIRDGTMDYDRDAYRSYIASTAYKLDGQVATRFLEFLDQRT